MAVGRGECNKADHLYQWLWPHPQPDMEAVAALPPRTQEELLDAIRHSIYNQPPTDWSKVTNLGVMRAVPEVKETVNLATQYMKAGYDPQALIARLAEIVCHDNFTEMHAFKHHQSIIEEYHATREPWRWMHLVCGAQAAAISFGKKMTVYEEYLGTPPRRVAWVGGQRGASRLPVCSSGGRQNGRGEPHITGFDSSYPDQYMPRAVACVVSHCRRQS